MTNIAIALLAAMLTGAGLVLQQQSAMQVPAKYFLQPRLIGELLRKRRWLAGIGIMAAGQALSMYAIGHLPLTVAEPLGATSLIFALILAAPVSGQRLRKSEVLGALLLSGGVTVLSVSRSINSQGIHLGGFSDWWAAAVIAGLACLFLRAGWRRTGQLRATLTGAAAGLVFGISDALTRGTVDMLGHHSLLAVLTSWPAYSLAGASILGLWLMESSFNAAPLNSSLPAITAAEPVAGIALGVVVFGDVIRISPAMLAFQAAGLLALITGVILVARAPVFGSLRPAALAHEAQALAHEAQVLAHEAQVLAQATLPHLSSLPVATGPLPAVSQSPEA
jgi:drug/metabolite transporter (DMT)-like permease